jgi:hypothetical protein
VLVADLITYGLGPKTFGAITVVSVLTLTAAVLLGGGPILAVQATVSAVYVAVVGNPDGTPGATRFVDALVGGAVALIINQLPLHRSPVRVLLAKAGTVFDQLSAVLKSVAEALDQHDHKAAQAALEAARSTDAVVGEFQDAIDAGMDAAQLHPLRRRKQGELRRYEEAAQQIEYAVRNVRVLARNVVVVTRGTAKAPPALAEGIRELGDAVTALSVAVVDESDDGSGLVVAHALAGVRVASGALQPDLPLAMIGVVWQIRSTAVDLMRGTGMELPAVLDATDSALEWDQGT